MLDYNGAEKGCGSMKKGLMMIVAEFMDGDDAYLAGEKEFSIIRDTRTSRTTARCA